MNTAKSLFCCFFCTALVFAQQPSEEKPFNTLRGFAYNPYGTLGAAPAIGDFLQRPSDIYGHKFVYVSPAFGSGYSAFDLAGGSTLLGFDQSLILGYAKSFYGLLLKISPNKLCSGNDDGYECVHTPGDNYISLRFSVPLSNSIIYASSELATNVTYATEYQDADVEEKGASIGITGGNTLAWDFQLVFRCQNTNLGEFNFIHTNTSFLFNIGYEILQSNRFKFIVGLNNLFYWIHIKGESDFLIENHTLHANIYPNFLGEVVLTKHLLAFAGAKHSISSEYQSSNMSQSNMLLIRDDGSGAYLGLRYERENWAVETRLQSDMFGEVLGGKNPFVSLGGFIWLMI